MRRFFDSIRGVDTLIWALVWINVVGLGPFAGVLAIALSDFGAFGKLFSEAIEAADRKQVEGIRASGGNALHEIRFGLMPQVLPVIAGQVLYFIESNTRSATIIGIVGAGRIVAGEKLPGENEIAETYRVNRHTVRRALAALAERGLVRAERGSGTYVETARLAYPLRSRNRVSEIVGAGGREPRGQFIDATEEEATRELARELGLKTGTPFVRIESVRLADRTPICVSTTWLSAERFPDAGKVFANVRSMTKLVAHYGIRDFRRASTRITAGIVDADRRRAAGSRARTSRARGRQHQRRYRRRAADDQAFALCCRARGVLHEIVDDREAAAIVGRACPLQDLILRSASSRVSKDEWHQRGHMVRDGANAPPHHEDY